MSPPVADSNESIDAVTLVTSVFVAEISLPNAVSNESIEASASAASAPTRVSNESIEAPWLVTIPVKAVASVSIESIEAFWLVLTVSAAPT